MISKAELSPGSPGSLPQCFIILLIAGEKRCEKSFCLRAAEQRQVGEAKPESIRTRNKNRNERAIDFHHWVNLWNPIRVKLSHTE